VGKGSVFSVTLPADRQIPETDSLDGEPLSVLVIEDDPVQLMAIRSVLESWDCRVFSASSGARALAVLASAGQQEPDLIMAELRLRGEHTGLQALEDVRRQMGREVPAILMTGDSGAERIKEAGADVSVLVKPFGPDHLRNAMEAMLARPVGSKQ